MVKVIINETARQMLSAACADDGKQLDTGTGSRLNDGRWLIELDEEVLLTLLRRHTVDVSSAVIGVSL